MTGIAELTSLRRHPTEKEVKILGAYGYSIWFMPDQVTSLEAGAIISSISQKFGTPFFQPHINLIGNISEPEVVMIQKMESLAHSTKAFHVALSAPQEGENYFKTIYANVAFSESLSNTNQYARQKFNKFGTPTYLPHMNFAYGNFTPQERSIIVREIVSEKMSKLNVRIERLELRKTDGSVESWKKIADVALPIPSRTRLGYTARQHVF